MKKAEHIIQAEIQLVLSENGVPVFRNNTGAYKTADGNYVRFGVGGNGGSDLIGITPIRITPDMVGKTVGVFTAIEVKSKTGRATEQQVNFIKSIEKQGGLAGVARSAADALKIISKFN